MVAKGFGLACWWETRRKGIKTLIRLISVGTDFQEHKELERGRVHFHQLESQIFLYLGN